MKANGNINLVELLKDAPRGTKLYSPMLGECELIEVHENSGTIDIGKDDHEIVFYKNGTYYRNRGECLIFPSKDNRDWTTFKIEKMSEDERIRKEIVDFVVGNTISTDERREKYLAWLERQDPKRFEEELDKAYKCADEVQYRKGYKDAKKEIDNDIKEALRTEYEKGRADVIAEMQKYVTDNK